MEQQRADDFQDLTAAGAWPEHVDRPAGRHLHHAARHQHGRRRVHDRRLLPTTCPFGVEHRPGQRRDRAGRLRHVRHRPGRSAARPPGHLCTVRAPWAASSSTSRIGPATERFEARFMGSVGDRGPRRPRVRRDRARERAARRQDCLSGGAGSTASTAASSTRSATTRSPSLTNPDVNVIDGTPRPRRPELAGPLRRALRAAVQGVRQVHGEPGGSAAERGQRRVQHGRCRPESLRPLNADPVQSALPVGVQQHEVPRSTTRRPIGTCAARAPVPITAFGRFVSDFHSTRRSRPTSRAVRRWPRWSRFSSATPRRAR